MSMPASPRGAQSNHASRLRPAAVAAVLALGIGLTGCANYETTKPYQPAAGVVADAPGMKVRSLMLISDGSAARLAGTLMPTDDDSLTAISAKAQKADGSPGSPLTIKSSAVKLPAGTGTQLYPLDITATGGAKAGTTATVILTFAKAAPITLTVPVLDPEKVDISTAAPSPTPSR